ncbi:BLUF domain-containing protein [Hoeflea sp. TYP-13]|uniref:BLUF domain-containing protein n=1 Tax=Hoeflea sp. TYP-13 TaxID=3230023 RepID=UPI0034C662D3
MKLLVYVSQATRPFTREQLKELLDYSRARNVQDGITGLLIYRFNPDYDRGSFLQVLEGPDAAIEDVWRRISRDRRHHTVVVIEDGGIERRMFGDWSMGFKNVDAEDLRDFPGFADLGSDAFWETASAGVLREALELLKSFYDGM